MTASYNPALRTDSYEGPDMPLKVAPGNFDCERCGEVTREEVERCPQNGCPVRKLVVAPAMVAPAPIQAESTPNVNPYAYSGNAASQQPAQRPGSLLVVAILGLQLSAIVVPIVGGGILGALRADRRLLDAPSVIGVGLFELCLLLLLASSVVFLVWLGRTWSIVPKQYGRIEPLLAVLLLFIPCFNLYWIIRVIPGLSKSLTSMRRDQDKYARGDAGFGVAVAGLILMALTYVVGCLAPLTWIVMAVWLIQANNTKNRYLESLLAEEEVSPPLNLTPRS